jgi:hypothetical protein
MGWKAFNWQALKERHIVPLPLRLSLLKENELGANAE